MSENVNSETPNMHTCDVCGCADISVWTGLQGGQEHVNIVHCLAALKHALAQSQDELAYRLKYDQEMSALAGAKRHYQDGLEVGGETLRGAIMRLTGNKLGTA
jgi:hypothetical protein